MPLGSIRLKGLYVPCEKYGTLSTYVCEYGKKLKESHRTTTGNWNLNLTFSKFGLTQEITVLTARIYHYIYS